MQRSAAGDKSGIKSTCPKFSDDLHLLSMLADDEKQVTVLATIHYAYAVLLAIGALLWLMLFVAGIRTEFGPAPVTPSIYESPQQMSTGLILTLAGAMGLLSSALLVAVTIRAARGLETRTSRGFCIVVAAINSLTVPFGTVLGIATIVTLMRPGVVQLFDQGAGDKPRGGIEPTSLTHQ